MSTGGSTPADGHAGTFLSVRDLSVEFLSEGMTLRAINGVDFDLHLGETLCFLGESGSGKTVTMRALVQLLPPTARIGDRCC